MNMQKEAVLFSVGIFSFDEPPFGRIGAGNFASGMVDFCLVDSFSDDNATL